MVKDNRRAITLFNLTERESSYLDLYKESVAHRINSADDSDRNFNWLNEYAATQANDLVITPPRLISVEYPEQSMAVLFDQLTRHERT